MTYEQARDELVQVVARLEAGGETLEGSLALWERGEALAARCQQWLDGARERLEAARHGSSGSVAASDGGSPRAETGAGETGSGETGSDETSSDETSSDKTGSHKTGDDELDLDEEDQR